jgi:hypothetical protein
MGLACKHFFVVIVFLSRIKDEGALCIAVDYRTLSSTPAVSLLTLAYLSVPLGYVFSFSIVLFVPCFVLFSQSYYLMVVFGCCLCFFWLVCKL